MIFLLRKIWAVYAAVVFAILVVLFLPIFLFVVFVIPERGMRFIIWLLHHVFTRLFFWLTLVFPTVKGRQHIEPFKKSYLIVSNHRSMLDFMLNAMAYPGSYRFLAKQELVKLPLLGFIVKKLCILVDRSSLSSRYGSIQYLREVLSKNMSILIYPEGTRNKTDKPILPMHNGVFRLAIETETPIAIQTILNVNDISRAAVTVDYAPGIVHIVWSEPISTEGMTMKDLPALKKKVEAVIAAQYSSG